MRAPASLTDSGYVDESWIGKPLAFLPTLTAAAESGGAGWLKLAVSEHSWGGAGLAAAAVANAEALGIFGVHRVELACRWTAPASGSVTEAVYKLLRGFMGTVAHTVVDGSADAHHFSAFAGTTARQDATAGSVSVLLICKYPLLGGQCKTHVSVAAATAALRCGDEARGSLETVAPVSLAGSNQAWRRMSSQVDLGANEAGSVQLVLEAMSVNILRVSC